MTLRFQRLVILALLLSVPCSLTSCLSVVAFPANFLAYTSGQKTVADINFGPDYEHQLNVYAPPGSSKAEKIPVVIFFYGGGWSFGSKDDFRFVAEPLTQQGYLVVIPDYRKFPDYVYPDFMFDAARAVSWVYKNIESYGGDNSKLFLMGHSAGGHIAALLNTNEQFLAAEGVPRSAIQGVIGLAGPYDFIPEEEKYKHIFAEAGGDARTAMPATYVDGKQAPMLLLYGLEDDVVYRSNIESMQKQVRLHGGELECKFYEGIGHVEIISVFSRIFRERAPIVQDVLEFIGRRASMKGTNAAENKSAQHSCSETS